MSKKSVAVRIAGNEYTIRSDSDEKSLREIAEYVDHAMARVRKGTGTVDTLDVAVLTCLNLGREILALKSQASGGASEVALRSLIDRVEAALPSLVDAGETDVEASVAASEATRNSKDAGSKAVDPGVETSASDPSEDASEPQAPAVSGEVKTLDLPSVELLHDRAEPDAESDESELPEARVAAGGRDRAS